MCPIIEQLAGERGIRPDDANYIFNVISNHVVNRIPALKQVMEDIFAEAGDDELRIHISKMIILLQQPGMEEFETWQTPHQFIIRRQGTDQIL
jgi:hypothetical protein